MATGRLLVFSFATTILAGTIALLIATALGGRNPFSIVDALFTSTSAVCVTGLVVRDTGGLPTPAQVVILLLIQLGGLGTLTFANLLFLFRQQELGLQGRVQLEASHGLLGRITPAGLLTRIIRYTLLFELAGAVILSLRFAQDFAWPQAIWLGVFHSVSAFCNAGFGLFANSLMDYRGDWVVSLTVICLVVLGGLGFLIFADFANYRRARRSGERPRLLLHTRTVLITTAVLILGGALVFTVLELANPELQGRAGETFLSALFLSVTARTAGFNTLDTATLSNSTLLILVFLMFVGGSPGSTAGGIKTTTLATLWAFALSRIRNRPRTELLSRSLPEEVVSRALVTTIGYVLLVFLGVLLLQFTEVGHGPHVIGAGLLLDQLFEVVSALATVGLSTGVTPGLSVAGKLGLCVLMFLGRTGPLLVAASLIGRRPQKHYTLPEEALNIG